MAIPSSSSSSSSSRIGYMLTISGLIGVQVILAIYTLYLHNFLSLGVNSLFLVICGGVASALLLLPFAIALEKKKWPPRLRPLLMLQMLLLSLAGPTHARQPQQQKEKKTNTSLELPLLVLLGQLVLLILHFRSFKFIQRIAFQVLMLFGNKMTSPAIASAMPNLAPGFIFIIAACVRFEKFSICCKYSRAKVLGTILCLGGAISMSFLMNPPDSPESTTFGNLANFTNMKLLASLSNEWIIGCFYLFSAVVFLSCILVLQAATMVNFPAPLSLSAVTALMGSIISVVWQYIMEGKLDIGTSNLRLTSIIYIVLLGGVVTSVVVGFQTWCIGKRGPVMVSIFSPIQTVFSAVLSAFFLGQFLSLGSLAGMIVMFVGLYIVLWAKMKEDCDIENVSGADQRPTFDVEKPFLA